MPVAYTIDKGAGLVRMTISGAATNQELLESLERLHTDPNRLPGMPGLVDCRDIEHMLITNAGLQAAAVFEAELIDATQPPWAVAVIAPRDEVFWAARTYEVLRAGSPETVRVFRNAVEAEGWVLRHSGPPVAG